MPNRFDTGPRGPFSDDDDEESLDVSNAANDFEDDSDDDDDADDTDPLSSASSRIPKPPSSGLPFQRPASPFGSSSTSQSSPFASQRPGPPNSPLGRAQSPSPFGPPRQESSPRLNSGSLGESGNRLSPPNVLREKAEKLTRPIDSKELPALPEFKAITSWQNLFTAVQAVARFLNSDAQSEKPPSAFSPREKQKVSLAQARRDLDESRRHLKSFVEYSEDRTKLEETLALREPAVLEAERRYQAQVEAVGQHWIAKLIQTFKKYEDPSYQALGANQELPDVPQEKARKKSQLAPKKPLSVLSISEYHLPRLPLLPPLEDSIAAFENPEALLEYWQPFVQLSVVAELTSEESHQMVDGIVSMSVLNRMIPNMGELLTLPQEESQAAYTRFFQTHEAMKQLQQQSQDIQALLGRNWTEDLQRACAGEDVSYQRNSSVSQATKLMRDLLHRTGLERESPSLPTSTKKIVDMLAAAIESKWQLDDILNEEIPVIPSDEVLFTSYEARQDVDVALRWFGEISGWLHKGAEDQFDQLHATINWVQNMKQLQVLEPERADQLITVLQQGQAQLNELLAKYRVVEERIRTSEAIAYMQADPQEKDELLYWELGRSRYIKKT